MVGTRRICCIEGEWGYGGTKEEPSIKPILGMFAQWEYWPFVHKRCLTTAEAEAFLNREWGASGYGSVLYLATHGAKGSVELSDDETFSLQKLANTEALWGQCVGAYVHVSACNVLEDESAAKVFLRETGAAAISGYQTDVGWAEPRKPALPLDIMLLNQLWEEDIDLQDSGDCRRKLRTIEEDLQRRFGDCQFKIMLPD